MRTFYDNLNQVDGIFSSKVILSHQILPKHLTVLNFCVGDTAIEPLSCLILMRTFQNSPNKLHIYFLFRKDLVISVLYSFLC